MTEAQKIISEAIRRNEEIIVSLTLQNQALASQLPQPAPVQRQESGYFIDPKTGERCWYDKKAKARWEREQKRLTLIKGGN
jgi:hypothetical protein